MLLCYSCLCHIVLYIRRSASISALACTGTALARTPARALALILEGARGVPRNGGQ